MYVSNYIIEKGEKKMKRQKAKKVFVSLLSMCLLATSFTMMRPVDARNSEITTKQVEANTVIFDQEYAIVNEPLTVSTALSGKLSYKWKVGNQIVSTAESYTPTEKDLENFISVEVSDGTTTLSTQTYFSRLPVIYIETENNADVVSKEDYINGNMKIQGNETYNSETTNLYDGVMEIKGRGNSTWGLPKKPYKIKLDSKTDLFGMGKSKHWVLLANYYDTSSLRNTLSYDLSGQLDMPYMQSVHVDVVFNGKYTGVYQFCEQIKVDSKRVDVLNWDDEAKDLSKSVAAVEGIKASKLEDALVENMEWVTSGEFTFDGKKYFVADYDYKIPSITGGYLLELDSNYDEASKFKTSSGQPIMFKSPEFVKTNSDMMNYVKGYIQAYENAVKSGDFTTTYDGEKVHYTDLFDMQSLVDYWIVTELFFNEDSMKKSTYMYKEVGEKFKMGPIWDMDWSSGASQSAAKPTNQWQTLYFPAYVNPNEAQNTQWYRYLIKDPYFVSCVKERYDEIRNVQIKDMMDSIEGYRTYLKETGIANGLLWYNNANKADSEITNLKKWLNSRLSFLDSQFASLDTLYDALGVKQSSNQSIVLKDSQGQLDTQKDYDGITYKNSQIEVQVKDTNSQVKKISLYANGQNLGTVNMTNGKASINHSFDVSGTYVLQAYGLDVNGKVIDSSFSRLFVEDKEELESIQIASLPNKLTYIQGEKIDLTGLEVYAIYNTGNKVLLNVNELEITSLTDEVGEQVITVTYNDQTASFNVTVNKKTVDKSQLEQLVEAVGQLKEEDYVPSTWAKIQESLTDAMAILADEKATQEAVDNAYAQLTEAYTNLEAKPNKTELSNLVKSVEALNKEEYTNDSWVVLEEALAAAKEVINNENATEAEVTEVMRTLIDAVKQLEKKDVEIDKTFLEIAVNEARAVTEEQLNEIVPIAVQMFKKSLEKAEAVLADKSATQEEVNEAARKLLDEGLWWLEFKKADKEALSIVVEQAKKVTEKQLAAVDPTIAEQFREALAEGEELLADENALKVDADRVIETLKELLKNFEITEVDKRALEAFVKRSEGLKAEEYYVDTWLPFAKELAKAKDVLEDPKVTQEEVNETYRALVKSFINLRLIPNKDKLQELLSLLLEK